MLFRSHLGSGILRIVQAYSREVFEIRKSFIRVTLPYAQPIEEAAPTSLVTGLADGLADGVADGLAESQRQILLLITENPRISKREMAERIGISTTAIDKNIATLKNKNYLRRVGEDKSGYWEVLKGSV